MRNKWYNNLRCNIEIMMQTDMIRDKIEGTNEITSTSWVYNSSFLSCLNLMLEYTLQMLSKRTWVRNLNNHVRYNGHVDWETGTEIRL